MEGGQAVDEPGLLLLDGDPGIVLLGVNQGRVGALSIKSEFENFKLGLSKFNLETNCIRPTVSPTFSVVIPFIIHQSLVPLFSLFCPLVTEKNLQTQRRVNLTHTKKLTYFLI